MMQKEQKLIQEEAQQAVLQAAASQPAAMAGATVGQAAGDSSTAAPAKVCAWHGWAAHWSLLSSVASFMPSAGTLLHPVGIPAQAQHCACTTRYPQPAFGCGAD